MAAIPTFPVMSTTPSSIHPYQIHADDVRQQRPMRNGHLTGTCGPIRGQGQSQSQSQVQGRPNQGRVWQTAFSSNSLLELSEAQTQNSPQCGFGSSEPSHRGSVMPPPPTSQTAQRRVPESTTCMDGVSTTFGQNDLTLPSSFTNFVNDGAYMDAAVGSTSEGDVTGMRPDYEGETFVIMAIQMYGRGVGCAYYDDQNSKIWILESFQECSSLDILDMIKTQVCPSLILANSKMEEQALQALRTDDTQQHTKVEIRPSTEFMYDMAKSKLLSLILSPGFRRHAAHSLSHDQGEVEDGGDIDPLVSAADCRRRQGLIDLSNMIDLDNVDSIGCAGALLSYLSRTRTLHTANDANHAIVLDLATFSLQRLLHVYQHEWTEIFEDESHPNIHSSVRGRKEGLSLFGILNSTRTPQGRHLLRQWFLRPSLDLSVIQGRQQSIECLSKPENQAIMDQMMRCLSRIKNIPRLLQAIHRKALLKDWQGIIQFACYSLKIYSMCHEFFDVETPIIHKIRQTFQVQELNEVGSLINDVVDFDESVIEGRCIVKPNVDEELDRMRQTYQGLDSFLSEVAKDISKTIPSHFASTFNVVYFPQLGYLITVPMNPNWKNENDFYLEGLSYQFSTEKAVYYKNNATRELDEHLGDIHGLIVDREIDILQTLQERVIEYSRLLILCSDLCAELDALLSLAQAAKLQRYTRPIMSDQTIIHIVNGRHPLQELCVESFVPNDIMIGEFHCSTASDATESTTFSHRAMVAGLPPFCPRCPNAPATIDNNHVMILCGPNCSGKSVYLKQVALITYMAHIGSFVPADHALIGLTDKILTRLQTRETVSKVHSTFMADLSQVSHAIRMATQRSLVVLDEFGKGTATTDGAGLFCGVMEHFAGLPKSQRPRVLATTHFHELFENQLMRVGSIDSLMSGMDKYDSTILQETATSERASATETAELEKSFWSAHAAVGSLQATAPPLSAHPDSASSSEPPLPISIYTMEALFDDTMFTGNSSNDLGNDVLQREPTFLFKVRPGRYPLSLGTACAATSGLPSLVVQRSIYLSQLFRRYEMVVPALGERDETRFEMYEQLIQRLLQLKFDELERPAGEDQDMTEDKLVEREKRTQEFEDNKVKPKLWADIVALLEYAEQVESFEKDEA